MDIVRREVCVQGNWKMLSGEEERDWCLRWGQAAWPRLHRVWRNSLKTWDVGVCALLSVFEPVTLLVRFVKLSLGCERCSL